MPIHSATMHYKEDNVNILVIVGKDYGTGSSCGWIIKGSSLLGVKAVLAENFERIHRSNLVMMGVLPLQFLEDDTAESLGLTDPETYDISLSENPDIHGVVDVVTRDDSGERHSKAMIHFDAGANIRYCKNDGILSTVVRKKLEEA